jgi:hypothetical protein
MTAAVKHASFTIITVTKAALSLVFLFELTLLCWRWRMNAT